MMGAGCLIIIFFGHFCYKIQKSFITSSPIKTMSLLQVVVVEGSLADKNSVSCRDDGDDQLPHIVVTAVHHFTRHDIEGMVMFVARCLHKSTPVTHTYYFCRGLPSELLATGAPSDSK